MRPSVEGSGGPVRQVRPADLRLMLESAPGGV